MQFSNTYSNIVPYSKNLKGRKCTTNINQIQLDENDEYVLFQLPPFTPSSINSYQKKFNSFDN